MRQRYLLALCSTLITLCGAEWIARRLRPEALEAVSLSLYTRDERTFFALRPGHDADQPDRSHVRVNSFGVRGGEVSIPKPQGVVRVLCLGDSFTFGLGVNDDESFPAVCERTLRDMGYGSVEVINCGVPAYGTDESLRFLEARGLTLEPDVVILATFPTNDAFDDSASGEYTVVGGRIVPNDGASGTVSWIDHFALYRLIHDAVASPAKSNSPPTRRGGARQRSLKEQFEVHRKVIAPDGDLALGRAQLRDNIARMRDLLASRGVPFGVVVVPSLAEVDLEAFRQGLRRDSLPEAEFDQAWPAIGVGRDIAALDIPFLDLGPVLRDATANDGRKLFLRNYHFNAAGNSIAGRRLAHFLIERLGIGPR